MNWLWVILVVAVIGGIISYISSNDNSNRVKDALEGGVTAGAGCGIVLLYLFLSVVGLLIMLALFGWLFGC
jgi:uncharacterized membrane protein